MKPPLVALTLVIAAAALAAPAAAQDGESRELSGFDLARVDLVTAVGRNLATADFDGDSRPDGAVVVDSGWVVAPGTLRTIELHFTRHADTSFTFESTEDSVVLTAVDVNRDGAPDIVVEQPFTHKRLHTWLNDGVGGFYEVRSDAFPSSVSSARLMDPLQEQSPGIGLPAQRVQEFACVPTSQSRAAPDLAVPRCHYPERATAVARSSAPRIPRAPPAGS